MVMLTMSADSKASKPNPERSARDAQDHTENKTLVFRGPQHASPYPQSRLAPAFAATDLSREIQRAEQMLGAVAQAQLSLITDQIRALQTQARAIIDRAEQDFELHRIECRFERHVGGIYHLYLRSDATRYFSMLSPSDWEGKPPHEFVDSFRLEADMRFIRLHSTGDPE